MEYKNYVPETETWKYFARNEKNVHQNLGNMWNQMIWIREYSVNGGRMIYSDSNEHKNGVGIIVSNGSANNMQGYWDVSDSHCSKNQSKNITIAIIQLYAPTTEHLKHIDLFCEHIDSTITQCKNREIITVMGD